MPKPVGANSASPTVGENAPNNNDHAKKTVGKYPGRTITHAEQATAKAASGTDARQSEVSAPQSVCAITESKLRTPVDYRDSGVFDMEDAQPETLSVSELKVLREALAPDDVKLFAERFTQLKGDFFHVGDYLVEHINELVEKIPHRQLGERDVSSSVRSLVLLWNCICTSARDHLFWSRDVKLTPLTPQLKAAVDKCRRLEQKRSKRCGEYLVKRSSSARRKASKAQTDVEVFKANHYLPEIDGLRQALRQQSDHEINRCILIQAHTQLHAIFRSNARNIAAEVDKWVRNILLNRTFIESGLRPSDIIQ